MNPGAPGRYTVPAPHITLVTNLVISHQRGKDRIAITTNGTYRYTFIESIKHALASSKSYICIPVSLSKKLDKNILLYHCFPVLRYCQILDKHTIVDMCYSKLNYQYIAHLRLRDIAQRNRIYQSKSINKNNNKLPNSEQSNKGKVKTHKYINIQNQSTTGKLSKLSYKFHLNDLSRYH